MRLLIINQFYVPDLAPTGHMAASLAEHRAMLGDQVTVVTSAGGYVPQSTLERHTSGENPRVIRLWTLKTGKQTALARLADYASFLLQAGLRALLLPAQDVIVSLTTPPFVAWTAILHKLLHPSTKVVLWNMDCYPEIAERTGVFRLGSPISRLLRWLNRRLFGKLEAVVCLDSAMESLLRGSYDPPSGRLRWHVIPNWESAALFPQDLDPPPWEGRDALGLESRFVILYLGNAGFGHSFETVLDAAERLREEPFDWLFVGGGSKWASIGQAASRREIGSVHMLPYVAKEATPSVLASADCALITMNENALGVISPSKLHACLAMGLPILYIGPPGSNVDDAVREFGVGVSLRQGDVEGVVGFVRSLRQNPEGARDLRAKARQAFEGAYVDTRTLARFDRVFDQARGGRS